jgi:predicted ArsR family transcriptional regulator
MRLSNSQHQIIRLLRRNGAMTVEDLSQALGISGVAVRQHLDALDAEGFLASRTEERGTRTGRGRPRRLFHLTEAADDLFPKNYGGLAEMVLEHMERSDGCEAVEDFFRARRRRFEADLWPRVEELDLEGRIAALSDVQDQAGYMSEWEKCADGSYVLREHNCAICKVAFRFPQACANELRLIQNVTGAEVTRESHIAAGDAVCAYRIRPHSLS